MKDNVTYNVKTIMKSNTTNEEELSEIFNSKLLKLIISFEDSKISSECVSLKKWNIHI